MQTIKTLQKLDSILFSKYVLKYYGPMSHLKLQKLLYYCDAYHLAYFNQEIISDKFEAWVHGPVSRKVYNSLKDKSVIYSEITYIEKNNEGEKIDNEFNKLTIDQKDLLRDVLNTLSQWTGLELEMSTHKELPWIEARKGYGPADKCEKNISKETTRIFYKQEISGENSF